MNETWLRTTSRCGVRELEESGLCILASVVFRIRLKQDWCVLISLCARDGFLGDLSFV